MDGAALAFVVWIPLRVAGAASVALTLQVLRRIAALLTGSHQEDESMAVAD